MRRSILSSLFFMSLTALSVAIGACATAPVDDDLSGLTQEQNPTNAADEESPGDAKLPPSSSPSKDETPKDAGTTPPKDASPPPKDASPPPTDSGSTATSDECALSYILKIDQATGVCPCSASECCLSAFGVCLPK